MYTKKILEQLNPIVKNAYIEYKEKSELNDCMPHLEENGEDCRFYVYEWFTLEPKMIFYIGRGTGRRYNHIIDDMNRTYRGDWYKLLQEKYGINYRIVLDNLTTQEADIYEIFYIWKCEMNGEVLIQGQYANSYWYGYNEEQEKVNDGIIPNIWIPQVLKRYFPERIIETPNYDVVEEKFLMNACLTLPNADLTRDIIDFIESKGGKIYKTVAKKAKCVIEFGVTDYEKYLLYKEKGYKIYHYLDVLRFIKNIQK